MVNGSASTLRTVDGLQHTLPRWHFEPIGVWTEKTPGAAGRLRLRRPRLRPDARIVTAGHPFAGGPGSRLLVAGRGVPTRIIARRRDAGPLVLELRVARRKTTRSPQRGSCGRVIASDLRDLRIMLLRRKLERARAGNVAIVRRTAAPLPSARLRLRLGCSLFGARHTRRTLTYGRRQKAISRVGGDQSRCSAARRSVRRGGRLATRLSEARENDRSSIDSCAYRPASPKSTRDGNHSSNSARRRRGT